MVPQEVESRGYDCGYCGHRSEPLRVEIRTMWPEYMSVLIAGDSGQAVYGGHFKRSRKFKMRNSYVAILRRSFAGNKCADNWKVKCLR